MGGNMGKENINFWCVWRLNWCLNVQDENLPRFRIFPSVDPSRGIGKFSETFQVSRNVLTVNNSRSFREMPTLETSWSIEEYRTYRKSGLRRDFFFDCLPEILGAHTHILSTLETPPWTGSKITYVVAHHLITSAFEHNFFLISSRCLNLKTPRTY